jgi:hypothetical protein
MGKGQENEKLHVNVLSLYHFMKQLSYFLDGC